jgi:hypothetical protein
MPSKPAETVTESPPAQSGAGPTVVVDVPERERAQLLQATRQDLEQTAELLGSVAKEKLSPDGLARLQTIEGLVQAATAARDQGEVQAAASLARKARLLAAELAEQ